MTREQFRAELEAAGFVFDGTEKWVEMAPSGGLPGFAVQWISGAHYSSVTRYTRRPSWNVYYHGGLDDDGWLVNADGDTLPKALAEAESQLAELRAGLNAFAKTMGIEGGNQ